MTHTLSVRIGTNPDHHLWNNNGTWWCHYTEHRPDFTKERVRRSLHTGDVRIARFLRDSLLIASGAYRRPGKGGARCAARFARAAARKPPDTSRNLPAMSNTPDNQTPTPPPLRARNKVIRRDPLPGEKIFGGSGVLIPFKLPPTKQPTGNSPEASGSNAPQKNHPTPPETNHR